MSAPTPMVFFGRTISGARTDEKRAKKKFKSLTLQHLFRDLPDQYTKYKIIGK